MHCEVRRCTQFTQAKLEHVNKEKDAHAARLQEAAAAREAQLHAEAEAAAQELYARVDALQAELDAVCEYREKQVGEKYGCTWLRQHLNKWPRCREA